MVRHHNLMSAHPMKTLWLGAAAAAALLAAAPAHAQPAPAKTVAAPPADYSKAPRMGTWGFDLSGRDMSVSPGQDFFKYANGSYINALQIPADRSRFGSFDGLNELSQNRIHAVLEKAAADKAATGERAQVGAMYRSFLDEARVEALGAKPLAKDLAAIKAQKSKSQVARAMGHSLHDFGGSFFAAFIGDDAKDPEHYVVYMDQAGLGLPDRDYYLEAQFAKQKTAYEAYVAKMLTLAGWPNAAANAKAIVAMETEIAKASWTKAEQRDDEKMYNPTATADLAKLAPGFDWAAFIQGAGLTKADRVITQEKTAFPKIAAIFDKTPLETLKAWQAFNLVDQASPYLSKTFEQAHFEFRDKTLSGQQTQKPRWKRGVTLVDNQIGEALGKLYVEAYFPPECKAKAVALVNDIRTAMKAAQSKPGASSATLAVS